MKTKPKWKKLLNLLKHWTKMRDITFANPGLLYLLLVNIPVIAWYVLKNKKSHATIQVSTFNGLDQAGPSMKTYLRHMLFVFRVLVLSLLIVVLARPQSTSEWQETNTEGIDIVIALDISGSMLAMDFEPDRLEASKNVAINFISGRTDDRIGLVVYSGESFTQCPVTTDHAVLINLFKDIKFGMIEDGTAIGLGLATSINRLKESDAKSKVIILLTDGVNNRGDIAPVTAAEIAKSLGIRVYTIGVGTRGKAPYPVQTMFGTQTVYQDVEIDEEVLREIAQITGGSYFRATDNEKLSQIYSEIDLMEKTKVDVKEFSKKEEKYLSLSILAAAILLLDILLRNTVFRKIP
jgi:Ca-activated chloride channel homolog